MTSVKKFALGTYAFVLLASIITGIIFYKTVVSENATHILSIIFGWQWIYLGIASSVVLSVAILKKKKNVLVAAGIMLVSLAIVLTHARIVESNRIYITGDGGPAGPHFDCLVWDNSSVNLKSGAYEGDLGLCTLMSIPSYNKFLIDQSRDADQMQPSATYYAVLAINELAILSGGWLAYRKLAAKSSP